MAWYNKYRPTSFSDVLGQYLVKSVLQNALKQDRIKHAYLLNGPKGVGKTTLARIFANSLNQVETNPDSTIDIVEMDAASNTGVDDIRQLIESSKIPPLHGKYKIYIIDEVHMLSKSAMNALLKILEEPPTYLIFLLATTNPEKLLPTVLSRLTKLNLTNHTQQDLLAKLESIVAAENLSFDAEALKLICIRSGGSQRDSINLLETIASYQLEHYGASEVAQILGLLPMDLLENIATELIENGQVEGQTLSQLEHSGIDGDTFLSQLLEHLLSQSLSGNHTWDEIILPIAQVLGYKLPLSGILSAVALLQVCISQSTGEAVKPRKAQEYPAKPKIESTSKAVVEKPAPTPIVENVAPAKVVEVPPAPETSQTMDTGVFENTFEDEEMENPFEDILEEAEAEEITPSIPSQPESQPTPPAPTTNTEQDEYTSISKLIYSLTQLENCPPIVKMIISDLQIHKVVDGVIDLSVSSGMFLSQLESAKVQSWITTSLESQTSKNYKIKAFLRSKNDPQIERPVIEQIKPKPAPVVANHEPVQTANSFPQNSVQISPVNETPVVSSAPEEDILAPEIGATEEVFYSIYRELPPNIPADKVPVIKPPVAKPQGADWDTHTHALFEFED